MNYDIAVSTNSISPKLSSLLTHMKREDKNNNNYANTSFLNENSKIKISYNMHKYSINICSQ
jgi:hypothetical protein